MKHLVLVDGHHLMYRAYWAIPRTLKTRAGEQSNTSFGMASMLMAILAKEEPDSLVICFDEGDKTFRHEEHDAYKDGRAETPDDFYVQIPRVMELMEAFNFPVVSDPQYEADDFLASYAIEGSDRGMRVTIVTGDKDAFQLASENIRIAIPHKGYNQAEYLGPDEVYEKLGVTPDQVAAFKGLSGDSSDNLKGVNGIGPKTASSLIQEFGSLKEIYNHLDDIRPALREKLELDKEQAFFCERMAELVCDIDLPISMEDISLSNLDPNPLLNFFTELEFTLLSKRFLTFLESDYGRDHFQTDTVSLPTSSSESAPKSEAQLSLFE
ncbi:MAG: 5'-3' exonuclease H3TH domain-containing protein [Candidatus Peribacteraceae bacterium]|jgi:DNA polymerase-1|nr:5'-3' exonuclease H3TH domain-containing protein [Candidatus Peribacteraceae bacterium]|tara:strand:+ start:1416 stop:2387 length:972 start_codon:yes stop_codon:yes gene_type:complete